MQTASLDHHRNWRALASLAVLSSIALGASLVDADSQGASEYISAARSAILIDAQSGATLFAKNADEPLPPASLSKLMTMAVAFKALKEKRFTRESEFKMSEHAWRTGGAPSRTAAMFVPLNSKVSLGDLIQGVIVQSGNDAAIAIAEGLAGSEAAFAREMQTEARRIGLTTTTFVNATGLDDPSQKMSSRDLGRLTLHLIKEYPEYYKWFAQREFSYRKHRFFNRNPLLAEDLGVDGLKTGHTDASGYGIAASANRDGRRLVAVVMGLQSATRRKVEVKKLLDWGFRRATEATIFTAGETIGYARVWAGTSFYVPMTTPTDAVVTLIRGTPDRELSGEIVYDWPLKPPIRKGDEVAKLRLSTPYGLKQEFTLVADQNIDSSGLAWRGADALALLVWRKLGF
ncbi:MAG: D-alanyl-D-alanine carboxypeptidase [Hyphomicrobium sp.]|nr:D-alanyl-D-alanine carboxypeptidase [Hyphomicrobium sp.]